MKKYKKKFKLTKTLLIEADNQIIFLEGVVGELERKLKSQKKTISQQEMVCKRCDDMDLLLSRMTTDRDGWKARSLRPRPIEQEVLKSLTRCRKFIMKLKGVKSWDEELLKPEAKNGNSRGRRSAKKE